MVDSSQVELGDEFHVLTAGMFVKSGASRPFMIQEDRYAY